MQNCIMRGKKMRPLVKSEPAAGGDGAQAGIEELQSDVEEAVREVQEGQGEGHHRRVRSRLAQDEAAAPDVESEIKTLLALSQAQALALQDMERRIHAVTESKDLAMKDGDQARQMLAESTEKQHKMAEIFLNLNNQLDTQREASANEQSRLRSKYAMKRVRNCIFVTV
jgi:hypothetical protein